MVFNFSRSVFSRVGKLTLAATGRLSARLLCEIIWIKDALEITLVMQPKLIERRVLGIALSGLGFASWVMSGRRTPEQLMN